jgi:hypothetical protein
LLREPGQFIAAKGLRQALRRDWHILTMADPAFHFLLKPTLLQLAHQGNQAISRTAAHEGAQQIPNAAASALA